MTFVNAPAPPSLHVLVRREDVDASRLQGRVVVVIDVLFATSTIVHALAAGASSVYPAFDDVDASRAAAGQPRKFRHRGSDLADGPGLAWAVSVAGVFASVMLPGGHAPTVRVP